MPLLSSAVVAQTASTPAAMLRCDSAVQVTAIDGDPSRNARNEGHGWDDCALTLTAGSHVIDICYNLYHLAGKYRIPISLKCKEVQRVNVDAQAGRVYRIKLLLDDPWRAWIVDVTALEGGLPDHQPQINKRKKKSVPKAERKSLVLLKMSPLESIVSVDFGESSGIWFANTYLGITQPLFKTDDSEGFSLLELKMGDTFALQGMKIPDKTEWGGWGGAAPCGDTYFPVFEDLPGGRVLYLGRFDIRTSVPPALSFDQADIEKARAWLERAKPGLGAKLEIMRFRWGRTMQLCNIGRQDAHLINAPGQALKQPEWGSGAAWAISSQPQE